jgi:Na+-transporting methylmalonyl-CoA/oxaloacetate decarboxylase gamma subunit
MTTIHDHLGSGVGGALTMSIIAFSVVFMVLGGLSAVIYGIKYMAAGMEKKKARPPEGGGSVGAAAPAPAPVSARPTGDGRLLAVLSAAVAATGERGRVVGYGPAGVAARPAPVGMWKSAGIVEGVQPLCRGWKR